MAAEFVVSFEARAAGFRRGARDVASATKEVTTETRAGSEANRGATTATDQLVQAERRRLQGAAELVRAMKSQIQALTEYQAALLRTASIEAARSAAASRITATTISGAGVDPSSRLGAAIAALAERQRTLQASIAASTAEILRADQVTGNIAALQRRTQEMQGLLEAARQGADAERAYSEALEVRRQIEASGARPGTDEAASVEREVRAQQRLEAELGAVARARQKEAAAAREQAAQAERVTSEIARLKETTQQLEVLAAAHRRGGTAVRDANVQLEIRNTLLRLGVSAGTADAAAIEQQIRAQARLRQEINQATEAKQRATQSAGSLRTAFFALQGAIATLGIAALIRDGVTLALTFDRASRALVAVTGNQVLAGREMAFVRGEAERLGLVYSEIIRSYTGLSAAAKGTALEGQATKDIFSAVAEAATVMGLSSDQAQGALLAIQQMMSKGTVQAEELRGQLGERLPGAFQLASRAMGVSTAKLGKMLEQGQVMAVDMLPKLAAEIRKTFGSGLINAISGPQAQINRLRNDLDQLKASAGQGFLEGFLAGFSELRETLTDAELVEAAKSLGDQIGEALRVAAQAGAFLADHLDLVKSVLIAIIALKAAAYFRGLALAIREAGGAAVYFRGALLALPWAALAVVIGYATTSLDGYIDRQNQAHAAEMQRVQDSAKLMDYYHQLRANTQGLAEDEWEYAKAIHATLEAQLAKAQAELTRQRNFYSQGGRGGFYADDAEGAAQLAAAVEAKPEVVAARQEYENLTNTLNALRNEWTRLYELKPPTLTDPKNEDAASKLGKKIADLIEQYTRAAQQAERMAAAQLKGADAAREAELAIARENAAWGSLHKLEGLSAAQRKELTAIIEGLVGREQQAAQAITETTTARESGLAAARAVLEAEARLADAKAGSTEATRALEASIQAQNRARADNRGEDAAYIAQLTTSIAAENERVRVIDLETEAILRGRTASQDLAGLQAQLTDARNQSTVATREHAAWIETEALRTKAGAAAWSPRHFQLIAEVAGRNAAKSSIERQTSAQLRLNEAQARAAKTRAAFADWATATAAAEKYGTEIAGILSQYGLLSEATRALELHEQAVAAARADGVEVASEAGRKAVAAIEAELKAQDQLDVKLRSLQAQHALLAHATEPIRDAWRQTAQTITGVIGDLIRGVEVDWKSLLKDLLAQWVTAIIEMTARAKAAGIVKLLFGGGGVDAGGLAGAVSGGSGATAAATQLVGGASKAALELISGAKLAGIELVSAATAGGGATTTGGVVAGTELVAGGAGSGVQLLTGGAGAATQLTTGGSLVAGQLTTAGGSVASTLVLGAQAAAAQLAAGGAAAGSAGATGGLVGGVGGGLGTGGALAGAGAALAGLAVFGAVIWAIVAIQKAQKTYWAALQLSMDATGRVITEAGEHTRRRAEMDRRSLQALQGMARQWGQGVVGTIEAIGGQLISVSNSLEISRLGRGKKTQYKVISDAGAAWFKSAQEALEFAIIQGARQAEVTGLSPLVEAALRRTTARTLDEFQEQMARVLEIDRVIDPGGASLREVTSKFDGLRRSLLDLDLPAKILIETLGKLALAEVNAMQASRDAITGRQRTAAEELADRKAQAQMWNAERALRIVQLQFERSRLAAIVAEVEATQQINDAERILGEGRLIGRRNLLEAEATLTDAELRLASTNINLIKAQLAAIDAILASMPKEIDLGEIRVGGGGGGRGSGRRDDQDRLRQMLEEQRLAAAGASEYQRALAEINRRWDEAIPLAHGDAALIAQIAAARKAEIDALKQQERETHREGLRPYLEDYGKGDFALQLEALQKRFADAKIKAKELGEAVWKVALAQQRATHELGKQAVASLNLPTDQITAQFEQLGSTLDFLRANTEALGLTQQDVTRITAELGNQLYVSIVDSLLKYVGNEKDRAALEALRYQMEIANIKLQFELVKGLGIFTQAQVDYVQGLIDGLPAAPPPGGGGGGGGDTAPPLFTGEVDGSAYYRELLEQQQEIARQREQAEERLRQYEEAALPQLTRELLEVNREFAELREVLGDTARVQAAYANAVQEIISRALEPIRQFVRGLDLSEYSPARALERLQTAQRQYQQSLAALAGGDLTQLESISGYAQAYLDQALAALPRGSAAYAGIFDQVQAAMEAILEQYGDAADLPDGTGDTTGNLPGGTGTNAPPPPVDLQPLTNQVRSSGDAQLTELREIRRNTGDTRGEVYQLRRRFDQPVPIFDNVS